MAPVKNIILLNLWTLTRCLCFKGGTDPSLSEPQSPLHVRQHWCVIHTPFGESVIKSEATVVSPN